MQVTPFRGIRCDVGQMTLKCPKKRKKSFSLAKKRLLRKCAHLGSNQGPKDYESDGHIPWKWGKNAISTLQKQYMNKF